MTKTLILMRHAKSAWDDPLQDDFDRGLNKRGRLSADALGNWLRDNSLEPHQTLCSAAVRARETHLGLDLTSPIVFMRDLYLSSPAVMVDAIKSATADRLLLIAHNPGMARLANDLVQRVPDHQRFNDFPTGATAVLDFDINAWTELLPSTGSVSHFIVPRDLTND